MRREFGSLDERKLPLGRLLTAFEGPLRVEVTIAPDQGHSQVHVGWKHAEESGVLFFKQYKW